jgi:hypothetical protein
MLPPVLEGAKVGSGHGGAGCATRWQDRWIRVSGVPAGTCVESEQQSGSGGRRGNWPGLGRYAGMGLELAAAIIALTLVGLWVDYKFGTGHKGVITGAVLGIVGGLYNFIRQALALMKQEEAARKGKETDSGDDRSSPS